ncbi:hypothetical protein [Streptomyces sp. Root369]|uniref:hypothetical protein n=1 Tax=Streptomyces sp. Root369 TaxID=1736523 RepID=UPI00130173E9|nr:hypothetical protein [Streptomyces sp. Root369]
MDTSYDDDSMYIIVLRFLNNGSTPVSVERVELSTFKWRFGRKRPKEFHVAQVIRRNKPVVPALDGTTFEFRVAGEIAPMGKRYTRFRVLLSNGRTALGPPIDPYRWIILDDDIE